MQELLSRTLRDAPSRARLHPGDLAWWLGWPPKSDAQIATTTELFEVDGRIRVWTATDGEEIGECVDPSDDGTLAAESDRRLAGRAVTRFARDDDHGSIERLTRAGWAQVEGSSFIVFRIDLEGVAGDADPRVRPVQLTEDVPQRAAITRRAFNVDKPFDRYTADYARFMSSPVYPAGWDLIAWAPSGDGAACAIAWPDELSGVGNFEPVATHPAYRRRGFAAAVLHEGCRRLRGAGMTAAIVGTPEHNAAAIALYRSVGFAHDHVQLAFRGA